MLYRVESDAITLHVGRRREAFREAYRLARENGYANLYDALCLEPAIHFERNGAGVRVCHCAAEARLLRAIFAEPHPASCQPLPQEVV